MPWLRRRWCTRTYFVVYWIVWCNLWVSKFTDAPLRSSSFLFISLKFCFLVFLDTGIFPPFYWQWFGHCWYTNSEWFWAHDIFAMDYYYNVIWCKNSTTKIHLFDSANWIQIDFDFTSSNSHTLCSRFDLTIFLVTLFCCHTWFEVPSSMRRIFFYISSVWVWVS